MEKYRFKLTPAFCLYNGVAVIEQKGSQIKFIMENIDDDYLRHRLEKSFKNFLENLACQEDCPKKYKRIPRVIFEWGTRSQVKSALRG